GKIHLRGHLNYREIIRRFERQSTFHGISHAALAPNTKWRVIWYTAFFVCLIALLIQIILLIRRYRTYAKTVDLDLKFENAPFPSVTLCNLNPYKASAIAAEETTRATMDAFEHIVKSGGGTYGVAAAIDAVRSHKGSKQREKRETLNETRIRRYHQVYAQCICEVNALSGERKKGSCFAAYKGNISITFSETIQRFHPSRCICQLDWVSKTLWPCFPYNTWRQRMCAQCSPDLGHCPMRFYEGKQRDHSSYGEMDVCLCHTEYNHCIANNENGYIIEIDPHMDVSSLNMTSAVEFNRPTTTTTTTTQTPELKQALGFEGLTDEIAINTQARQNLIFAVGQLPYKNKVSMSQTREEFILKCSFNQRDCDIKKDFKLHYDQTYGNCFTFNWNRTKAVTAHRAGANYGLRVLLYANVTEYLPTSESVGFRITVHDKWIVPFPDAFGYSAPTGFLSSFGVRMKQFNRIPAPHGQCLDGGEDSPDFIYKGFNYSVEGCHRSCTQKEVIRLCGCADPMYPIPEGAKSCKVSDPVARECIKNTSHHLGRLIAEGHVPNCVCHQPCHETNYEVTYSSARWPSGTTKIMECEVNDDLCMERYRKNAAMLQIFYEELNYETLTEAPAYTLTSALADLGGLTGLWIGSSVVSLLEIAALIVYCAQAYVRKKRKGSSTSSNQVIHPIIYPKYSKRSISSVSTIRTKRQSAPTRSTPSSIHSIVEDTEKQLEPAEDIPNEDSPSIRRKSTYPYLAPGEDLPCDCIYDENGRIKLMKALCPEHGYLVRRGTGYRIFDDVEIESESTSDEERSSLSSAERRWKQEKTERSSKSSKHSR
uniref:Degenerin n=1 Tax=Parascaris univalens TaxID=6257 RepID=A0A915B2H7_PARUN